MSSSPKDSRKFCSVIDSTHGPDNIRPPPHLSQTFNLLLIITLCLQKYDVTGRDGVTRCRAYGPWAKMVILWAERKRCRKATLIFVSLTLKIVKESETYHRQRCTGRALYRQEYMTWQDVTVMCHTTLTNPGTTGIAYDSWTLPNGFAKFQ